MPLINERTKEYMYSYVEGDGLMSGKAIEGVDIDDVVDPDIEPNPSEDPPPLPP